MISIQKKLAVCFLLFFPVDWAVAQETRNVPLQSEITQVQPMTGVVLWTDHEKIAQAADAISLEYSYVGYDDVVSPTGDYDFTKVDKMLDDVASRNHQAILRFYFCYVGKRTTVPKFIRSGKGYQETVGKSEGKKTHFCDWSNRPLQDFTLDFYAKLAERYDRDPRIAFLQTGFGLWAEYHIYEGPRELGKTFPSKEYQSKFLRHLDRQFKNLPWSISIDSADYDYSPLEDNEELLPLGFGVFDDSFLSKSHPKENAVNWKILDSDRWKRQPGGGEFSYYNQRDQRKALAENGPNGVSFQTAAKQFHISYMIGNDQPEYRSMQQIADASMATGYRFRVVSAFTKGGDLKIRVSNDGVAPIYYDAWFSEGEKRSKTSLKGLLPGQTLDCKISDVTTEDLKTISIACDDILPTQRIQFAADLR